MNDGLGESNWLMGLLGHDFSKLVPLADNCTTVHVWHTRNAKVVLPSMYRVQWRLAPDSVFNDKLCRDSRQ